MPQPGIDQIDQLSHGFARTSLGIGQDNLKLVLDQD
jgi:hypothetical protein